MIAEPSTYWRCSQRPEASQPGGTIMAIWMAVLAAPKGQSLHRGWLPLPPLDAFQCHHLKLRSWYPTRSYPDWHTRMMTTAFLLKEKIIFPMTIHRGRAESSNCGLNFSPNSPAENTKSWHERTPMCAFYDGEEFQRVKGCKRAINPCRREIRLYSAR